jgi:hypothetical protein
MPDFDRWSADRGDETLRLDYDIKPEDLVIDCGAYHGSWSRRIYDRYKCRILAFEPIREYFNITQLALADTNAIIYNSGIGPKHTYCDISVNQDSSSLFVHSGRQDKVEIVSVENIFRAICDQDSVYDQLRTASGRVRLMKINIEGAEYDLLDHMIDAGLTNHVDDIQVQFHQFVDDAVRRRDNIKSRLSETHHLTYDYEFVWENWRVL